MSTASRGSARERQYKALMEQEGWTVIRPAGSKGAADLVALKDSVGDLKLTMVQLIQVKANKGSPWMNFRKDEREVLAAEAHKIGALPVLIHWPAHGRMREYKASEWPR